MQTVLVSGVIDSCQLCLPDANIQFVPPEPEDIWSLHLTNLPGQTQVMKCILQHITNVRGVVLEAHRFHASSASRGR